ncbi:ATP-binding protein [Streptomyces sp. NPDC001276]|uniref:ATP-binding protein n=1 Tax=Streptomyces sp. NPDC001276 TaxID=3364555 RepID=UPI0036CD7769
MTIERLTAGSLDYLQRVGFEPPPLTASTTYTEAPPELRTLVRVKGIGRFVKRRRPGETDAPDLVTRDLLVGLHQYKVPVAFLVGGEPGRVSLRIGTWLPAGGKVPSAHRNGRLLESALQALYPAIDLVSEEPDTGSWPLGSLVLGVPSLKLPAEMDGLGQFDRLLQGLGSARWIALVLAQPVDEGPVRELRMSLINEMRSVETGVKLDGAPSPLADHYLELLSGQLRVLSEGQGSGAWRTAVYLLSDSDGFAESSSLWRGVFSGRDSLPEPVRVWEREDVPALAAAWALPDPVDDGFVPGLYRQPLQHQTLLTSSQLAAYIRFPETETPGFAITEVPDFDTVPPAGGVDALVLGTVVERARPTATPYGIRPDALTRHAFVTGVTGSGKTNSVFHLLRQTAERGVPFLVLEPVKTEYRVLLRDPGLGSKLQVLTLGNENVSPFRLNPFEVPEGIPIAVHLDLLRSVFNASFGMWTPLPQILEKSLHAVYADRGWDITTSANQRLDAAADRVDAFPTLGDLVHKVEEIVPRLGYEQKIAGDMRAALCTRLNSLRTGGKGRMLDTNRSLPVAGLLGQPTVLELEGMGDDDDKAFMMGLLMIRLAEQRRIEGDTESLRHLLVVEEAHRLLADVGSARSGSETEADVKGKAVETFTGLLSEIRAYGQGVIVVDQIPTKVARDVLKNTNLKVAHRMVAGDDRQVLGDAMVMSSRQDVAMASIPTGRAAVFADGEDAPLLIHVPQAKGGSGSWPTDTEVRERMGRNGPEVLPLPAGCDASCLTFPEACEAARALVLQPPVQRAFARAVLSAVQTKGGLERGWPDVVAVAGPRMPRRADPEAFLRCLARHASRQLASTRGNRAGWTYADTASVAELINRAILALLTGRETAHEVTALRRWLLELDGDGPHGPFQGCARIWADRPGPCLCRHPVAEAVTSGDFADLWATARDTDRASGSRSAVWDICQDAAFQLVEYPADDQEPALAAQIRDVARCTGLCFAQQMLAAEAWAHPATERRALTELLTESGHERPPEEGGPYRWER